MTNRTARLAPLDLSEQGVRDGQPIRLDRRLFLKFSAFGGCEAPDRGAAALAAAAVEGALYLDASDPTGIGVLAISEDPEAFTTVWRETFARPPFSGMRRKGEFDMLGRTYSIGYESDLEETLLRMPRRKVLDPANAWALWYPLRRSPDFYRLPGERRRKILGEHGAIGRRYGAAGVGHRHPAGLPRARPERQRLRRRSAGLPPASAFGGRRGDARNRANRAVHHPSRALLRRPGRLAKPAPGGGTRLKSLFDEAARRYDAVLVVSFGGPEGPEDVMPFLDNVLHGLPITPAGRQRIAERYFRFGGVSPIAAYTREFVVALQNALAERGPRLPVYLGNRNWHPLLPDTLARMAGDGVPSALVHVTSTFSSYSGCRRYREDLFAAAEGVPNAPRLGRVRFGYNHPGFIAAMAERLRDAFARFPQANPAPALVFTAHSLPLSMANGCDYEAELRESCRLTAQAAGAAEWALAYQSQNASYGEPWLGPDMDDALRSARNAGHQRVVVAPIGFVCDHLEVVLDLDVEAAETARDLGIRMVRAGTVGTHPAYVEMVRELLVERMTENPKRRTLGDRGPRPDLCPADCCLSGRRGGPRPTLCGADAR